MTTPTTPDPSGGQAGPVEKFTLGSVHVSVWKNTDRNGTPYYSVRVERRYKDDAGNYQTSNAFPRDALPIVADFVMRAHKLIDELQGRPVHQVAGHQR